MKTRQVSFFLYWLVKNAQFCIDKFCLGWLSGISNIPRFYKNENSLERLKCISENSSPKGSFWCNKMKFEFSVLSSDLFVKQWTDNSTGLILFLDPMIPFIIIIRPNALQYSAEYMVYILINCFSVWFSWNHANWSYLWSNILQSSYTLKVMSLPNSLFKRSRHKW